MKTKTVFETPQEFFAACVRDRARADESPTVPVSVEVRILGNGLWDLALEGEGSDLFEFSGEVNAANLIKSAFETLGTRINLGLFEVDPAATDIQKGIKG